MADVDIPHFQVPFSFGPKGARVVDQDGPDDHAQRLEALFRTAEGQRLEEPDYGMPELILREGGPDLHQVAQKIVRWEPEVFVELDMSNPNKMDELYYQITARMGVNNGE